MILHLCVGFVATVWAPQVKIGEQKSSKPAVAIVSVPGFGVVHDCGRTPLRISQGQGDSWCIGLCWILPAGSPCWNIFFRSSTGFRLHPCVQEHIGVGPARHQLWYRRMWSVWCRQSLEAVAGPEMCFWVDFFFWDFKGSGGLLWFVYLRAAAPAADPGGSHVEKVM